MRGVWHRGGKAIGLMAAALLLANTPQSNAPGGAKAGYAEDAVALDRLIVKNYAYEERWPGGKLPDSAKLAAERAAVHDSNSLLHYAEDRIATLADHHALTNNSFANSWAIVPSYADLWVVPDGKAYRIDAVRSDSPAAKAGIHAGDILVAVNGVPIARAVADFWAAYGLTPDGTGRRGFAARTLAAGRRDKSRQLTISNDRGVREVTLETLYKLPLDNGKPPLTVIRKGSDRVTIKFHNSLGNQDTIAAFDRVLAELPATTQVVLDLTDTPSGGVTSVARGIMSWFVKRATNYQMHQYPAEARSTGIIRQWVEQVVPRSGKYHPLPVAIHVGRWTGSMGEGLAVGFSAMGVPVCGQRMAGLAGGVYNYTLPASGMVVKFPAERIYTVSGQPREDFVPTPMADCPR